MQYRYDIIYYFHIFYCTFSDLYIFFLFLTLLELLIQMSRYNLLNKTVIKLMNYCVHDRLQSELYSHATWPHETWHVNYFHTLLFISFLLSFYFGAWFSLFWIPSIITFFFSSISNTQQTIRQSHGDLHDYVNCFRDCHVNCASLTCGREKDIEKLA